MNGELGYGCDSMSLGKTKGEHEIYWRKALRPIFKGGPYYDDRPPRSLEQELDKTDSTQHATHGISPMPPGHYLWWLPVRVIPQKNHSQKIAPLTKPIDNFSIIQNAAEQCAVEQMSNGLRRLLYVFTLLLPGSEDPN